MFLLVIYDFMQAMSFNWSENNIIMISRSPFFPGFEAWQAS